MDFRGHLRLPDDVGTGIAVVLRLDDIFVIISAGDEELGAWRADDVEIERIFSNQFAIDLDGEPMVFVAQDALGFAYEGITAIEDLQERLTKRGIFRRARKKDKKTAVVDAEEMQPTEAVPEPVTREPSRRPAADLVSHLDQPDEPAADIAAPDPQPVPPPSSTPLWTPATARAVPSEGQTPVEHEDAPIQAEPRAGSDTGQVSERPAETRVSYPRTPVPPPPSVDSFVPPDTEIVPTTQAEESEPQPAPKPAPVPEAEPEPLSEPVADVEVQSEPEPQFEVEIEIEEVTAASSGTPWEEADVVPQAESEIEIEIEEYIPPTAGAVDTFVTPQAVPEPAAAVVPGPEPELELEPEPEEVPEPEPEAHAQPDLAEPATEMADVAKDEDDSPDSRVAPAQPEVAASTDEPAMANGHKAEKRRSFLFGRARDKSVPVHDHQYGEPKTIGGLTRAVCSVCGHVTFSGQDVYQDW